MKQVKRLLWLLLIVFCVVALAITMIKKKKEPINIGVDLPLTGAYAYWGNEFKYGADIFMKNNPDKEEALKWYRLAAEQGDPDAAKIVKEYS